MTGGFFMVIGMIYLAVLNSQMYFLACSFPASSFTALEKSSHRLSELLSSRIAFKTVLFLFQGICDKFLYDTNYKTYHMFLFAFYFIALPDKMELS